MSKKTDALGEKSVLAPSPRHTSPEPDCDRIRASAVTPRRVTTAARARPKPLSFDFLLCFVSAAFEKLTVFFLRLI